MKIFQSFSAPALSQKIGYILAFCGAVAFSAKAIFVKLAYEYEVDSVSFLAIRMLFALPLYLLILAFSKKKIPERESITWLDWLGIIFFGLIGYYFASWLDFIGLQYVTASLERLILFTYPTFTLLISVIFLGQKIQKIQILAVLLTYSGISLAFINDLQLYEQKDVWTGASFILGSALVFAVYLNGTGKLIQKFGTLHYTTLSMTAAGVGVLVHTYFYNQLNIWDFKTEVYSLGALTGIFSTVISSFMFSAGIRRVGASNASLVGSIGPVSTIIMASIFLNEAITLPQIFGTVLVISGILTLSIYKK